MFSGLYAFPIYPILVQLRLGEAMHGGGHH
jgi:hypothetical protein